MNFKKERSDLELLIELRNFVLNHKKDFQGGLCYQLGNMRWEENLITLREKNRLINIIIKYIRVDRGLNTFIYDKRRLRTLHPSPYFWKKNEVEPRLRYLDYLIERYNRK